MDLYRYRMTAFLKTDVTLRQRNNNLLLLKISWKLALKKTFLSFVTWEFFLFKSFRLRFLAHNFPRYFGCWHELFCFWAVVLITHQILNIIQGGVVQHVPKPAQPASLAWACQPFYAQGCARYSEDSGWLRLQKNLSLLFTLLLEFFDYFWFHSSDKP